MNDVAEVFVQLVVGERFLPQYAFDGLRLVREPVTQSAGEALPHVAQQLGVVLGKVMVRHPQGIDHFFAGKLLPLRAQVVVVEPRRAVVVEPECIVADKERARSHGWNGCVRGDTAHLIVRLGTVGIVQDDFQQAMRGS